MSSGSVRISLQNPQEKTDLCSQVDEAAISSSFRQKWSELQKLLERQRSRGGIIDLEVESNRFLIHINEVGGGHSAV